jgi:hypothetical protein
MTMPDADEALGSQSHSLASGRYVYHLKFLLEVLAILINSTLQVLRILLVELIVNYNYAARALCAENS